MTDEQKEVLKWLDKQKVVIEELSKAAASKSTGKPTHWHPDMPDLLAAEMVLDEMKIMCLQAHHKGKDISKQEERINILSKGLWKSYNLHAFLIAHSEMKRKRDQTIFTLSEEVARLTAENEKLNKIINEPI